MNRQRGGFTIVELLIVIVVIAILAVITIAAYNGIQDRARASLAAQGLSQAVKKLKLWQVEQDTNLAPSNLAMAGISDSGGVTYQYTQGNNGAYCITTTVSNKSYYMSDTITTPTSGGCPGHGQGGVAPVTNLAVTPAATAYSSTQSQFGWRSDRYLPTGSYSLITGASDGPTASLGTYARYTFTQTAPAGRGFHHVGNTEGSGCGSVGYPVTPGTTYTLSSYFRSSDGQGVAVIQVRYCDNTGTWIGSSTASTTPIVNGTSWVRPSVTTTAPAGATLMHAQTQQGGSIATHAVGDKIDGTGLMVTQSSTSYNYADGNSPNWIWNTNGTSTGPPL